ncbi:MAG: CHAT domain-containing protein [Anaerolineales bacterium]|nr:CHAT domain-containing protein [Anaerolineales bacterium]
MNKTELLEALLTASDIQARLFLLKGNPDAVHVDIVYALKEQADTIERDDARRSLEIGQIAEEVAEYINDDEACALAIWAQANAHDSLAELEAAVQCYERAAQLFNSAGKPLDAARISIGHMFTLMKLGQFDQALALAESARIVFIEQQDTLYLAKLDMNLGNIHYSQGQYALAVESFERATTAFTSLGENFYAAMSKINQANSLLPLDDFLLAEQLHEQARPVFEEADLRTAAASVDYDLALLQYARGNYAKSFQTYERARAAFSSLNSQVNLAMTDYGESDLYLDLNLPDEALRLARQAEQAFAELGITYELARSKANHALALARLGQREKAIILLAEAQKLFLSLGNDAWGAHTDIQRAEVLGQDGQYDMARSLTTKAAQSYEKLGMKTRQAYAHILAATFWADNRQWEQSLQELQIAKQILGDMPAPWLTQRIDTGLGRVYEGMGKIEQAIAYYKKAVGNIEQMTAALAIEEHRTAFVADKLAPYEALVTLHAPANPSLAFTWAEQAKSRALVNLLSAGVRPKLRISDEMDAHRAERLQEIRDELNWLYTRLTRGVAPGETGVPAASPETWAKIDEREQEATSIWRNLRGRHTEELSLIREAPLTPADVQPDLPKDTLLVEYFIARGQITAFLITPSEVRSYPAIASTAEVLNLMEKLSFQFSKFQYGTGYYQRHKTVLLQNTQDILSELGQKLIGPFWNELSKASAIIVIPHGPLHALPFQSLRLDNRYLIETHAVSYAPSASVLKFCWKKSTPFTKQHPYSGKPLLVGVPDERISHVTTEVNTIANIFGEADILLGEQATLEHVNQAISDCGVFHLAAHGLFRPEAPLLSSIRLFDQWLAVQDIYNLNLKATLVTLSACETGLGHDAGGDDLVGLVRGFLYAGAVSLIVSLWTVNDEAMTRLVTEFYFQWLSGHSKVEALRKAQISLLKEYEHPYYWSPLILIGSEK